MKVLVTGGAGFIGSAVVDRLLALGHTVSVFDSLETGLRENVPAGVPLVVGDVRDAEAVAEAIRGHDAVVHLAAFVSVQGSFAEPGRCLAINVDGTRNVLAGAKASGVDRVVLASTAALYGLVPTLPAREGDLPAPASPYAESKAQNEIDARRYFEEDGLSTVCLRFFNVYGPRQRPDSPYAGVIAKAADAIRAERVFTLFGDGSQTRDFIYVGDIARAVATAVMAPGLGHAVINVGTGRETSVRGLVLALAERLGRQPILQTAPMAPGDVKRSVADVSRLRGLLGLEAEVSLAEGLAALVAWQDEVILA